MWALREIVVDVPDCPLVPPLALGVPSWVVGWGMAVAFVLCIALIVSVAVIRYQRHGERTAQLKSYNQSVIETAKLARTCTTCGADYDATSKLKRADTQRRVSTQA